jgi:hypothetical protein
MPEYLFTYFGGDKPAGASADDEMKKWSAWYAELGPDVADPGKPVGSTTRVGSGQSSGEPVSGYSIIRADSEDQARRYAESCPIVANGGTVEFAQTFEVQS